MSRISLIPFREEHFPLLMGWFHNQQEVTQWAGSGPTYPVTPSQLAAMLQETETSPPRRYCWMAVSDEHEVVGHAQLAIDWNDGVARLGGSQSRHSCVGMAKLASCLRSSSRRHSAIRRLNVSS
jgi:hypothetical protein